MNLRTTARYLSAATVVALTATSLVALGAGGAQAAATQPVTASLQVGDRTLTYGDKVTLLASARDTSGNATDGSHRVGLQRKVAGGSWQTIRTAQTTANNLGQQFWSVDATANAQYRVNYLGGTDADGDVWAADESNVVSVKVAHRINSRTRKTDSGAVFKGTVSPRIARKVVWQTKKPGRAWKTVRKLKLTKGTRFKFALNGATGQKFRLVVPATAKVGRATAKVTLITRWTA